MTIIDSASAYPDSTTWPADELEAAVRTQRSAQLAAGPPSLAVRLNRLDRLAVALLGHAEEFADAVSQDFGNRPRAATLGGEIATCVQDFGGLRGHLATWMKPRRPQSFVFRLAGIDAWIEPSPLGVVGVIAPWNFPVALAVQPAAAALAAGNRVMLKMSEVTPRTADVMRSAIAEQFDPDEFLVVTGGPEVGARFSRLAFDHLFFTGAPSIGREVQRAAAENLVPVTLELGGKNPVVVGTDADLRWSARRIARARLANGGQICVGPDYVFAPRPQLASFLEEMTSAFRDAAPTVLGNDDYCSIVNDRHYQRVTGLVRDAETKGAEIIEVAPHGERFPSLDTRRIPPTLITRTTDDMDIMREEVFGPLLAVLPYDSLDEVIDYVNDRPSPLAAYWFGADTPDFRRFKSRTRSGGVTRNDFALHAGVDGLPFGGVGNSGSGYYHGQYGFDTFSHLRSVAVAPRRYTPTSMLTPPFSPRLARGLSWFFRRETTRITRRLTKQSSLDDLHR
jgi:coniferyl-aldehyde dehydrogenase